MTITASEIIAMDDRTIGIHAAGGFGVKKRQEFIAAVRRAALAEIKAGSEPVTFAGLMGVPSPNVSTAVPPEHRARGVYLGTDTEGPSVA